MFDKIKRLSFLEIYFRLICLLFWPIYWYKWMVITIENYNIILFYIYSVVDILFILILVGRFLFKKTVSKIYFVFQLATALTYFLSTLSFMVFSTNRYVLYAKIFMCLMLIMVSWKLVKKEYNDIGVVGILSGLLILIITYFY